MKKFCWVLMLCLLLAGCGKQEQTPPTVAPEQPAASSVPEQAAAPTELESLTVEFLRTGADGALLLQAVKKLPEEITAAFAEAGIIVEEVKVTMSGSSAATAQAGLEGGVTLAILPAAEAAQLERCPTVAALAGERKMYLHAANTSYGSNLASRPAPTWTELDHARWGVLREDPVGRDAVELWLADHYEGNTLSDLSSVTEYADWDALLAAAAAGEIDVFPASQVQEGCALLGESESLYTTAAVVSREDLVPSLPDILAQLQEGKFALLFGEEPYASAPEGALDPQRRLWTMFG